MALSNVPAFPWLLYAYPWMPYPRRVIIYLREKGIPSSLVTVVRVSNPGANTGVQIGDPQANPDTVLDNSFPPRPKGSLPILAIPSATKKQNGEADSWTYIRQSTAIMSFLEELCNANQYGFSSPHGPLVGQDALSRARAAEVMTVAEELQVEWNSVRAFGTGAGSQSIPAASKEMLRWVHRSLMAIETCWQEEARDLSFLRGGVHGHVTMADVVLYQFLEFAKDCYGKDVTIGSGEKVKTVYGREVEEKYPKLAEFFEAFRSRDSARKNAELGEEPPASAATKMQTWADGAW